MPTNVIISVCLVLLLLMTIYFIVWTSRKVVLVGSGTDSMSSNCGYYECSQIGQFKTIVKDFNCQESATFTDVLDGTNKFTMFASLFVNDYGQSGQWQHLFHAGDPISNTVRTPGVWLNDGYLHVRGTSVVEWDDGGSKCSAPNIRPQLEVGKEYSLLFVYNVNQIEIYIDGKLIQKCGTSGDLIAGTTLYVGKTLEFPNGLDIDITLAYLPQVLTADQVSKCWGKIDTESTTGATFSIPDGDKENNKSCVNTECPIYEQLSQFVTVVKDFNTEESLTFTNILAETNEFTISASMYVNDYSDVEGWQHLFHAGDPSGKVVRTPGVWINQGYLHIRATSPENVDDGGKNCFAPNLEPALEKGMYYSLILVYNNKTINVYINGKLIQICETQGSMVPGRTLYVGKTQDYPNAPDIDMSLCYLPQALTPENIEQCWLYIKDIAKDPVAPDSTTTKTNCQYTNDFQDCGAESIYIQNCEGQFLLANQENGTPIWSNRPTTACCFRFVSPIFDGQYPPNSHSIESMAYPGFYLRHASYIMRLDSPNSQQIHDDFVFQVLPGMNDQPNSVTLKPVQSEYNKSCFYSDGQFLQFTNGRCPENDSTFKNEATFNTGNPNLLFS